MRIPDGTFCILIAKLLVFSLFYSLLAFELKSKKQKSPNFAENNFIS